MEGTLRVKEVLTLSTNDLINQLFKTFCAFIKKDKVNAHPAVFISGQPGIGKSQSIIELKDRLEKATHKKVIVTDVRLLLFNPVDLRGIPIADKKEKAAIWLKPHIFNMKDDEQTIHLLFLDELTAAPKSIQAAAYQIALDKKLGEHKLPKNTFVIAAGNRVEDNAISYDMPSALKNRFMHFELKLNVKDWLNWAEKRHIHPEIIEFISNHPNHLSMDNFDTDSNIIITPRSYEMLSQILECVGGSLQDNEEILKSVLGKSLTQLMMMKHEPLQIEEIKQGKIKDAPKELSELQAIVDIIDNDMDNILKDKITTEHILNYLHVIPVDYGLRIFRKIAQAKNLDFLPSKLKGFGTYLEKVGESFKYDR
jgi:hypothetical protein